MLCGWKFFSNPCSDCLNNSSPAGFRLPSILKNLFIFNSRIIALKCSDISAIYQHEASFFPDSFSRMARWQSQITHPADPPPQPPPRTPWEEPSLRVAKSQSLSSPWQVVRFLGLSQSAPRLPRCRCQELSITFYLRCNIILPWSPVDTCAFHASSQGLVMCSEGRATETLLLDICANPASPEEHIGPWPMETHLSIPLSGAHEADPAAPSGWTGDCSGMRFAATTA